jgi:hypothetical protein
MYYQLEFAMLLDVGLSCKRVSGRLFKRSPRRPGLDDCPPQGGDAHPFRAMRRRELRIGLLAKWMIAGAYLIPHIGNALADEVLIFPDSRVFLAASRLGFHQLPFGAKPAALPLVIKFFSQNLSHVATFQCVLLAVAFLFLAWSAASLMRRPLAEISLFAVMLLLSFHVALFASTRIIVSESVSSAFLALGVGGFLRFLKRPGKTWGVVCGASLVVFAFCRDSNAYHLVGFAVFFGLFGIHRVVHRQVTFLLVSVLLTTVLLSGWVLDESGRWKVNLRHVIEDRLLTDNDYATWLTRHGAPSLDLPDTKRMEGRRSSTPSGGRALDSWMESDGRRTYALFLLTHPTYTVTAPLADVIFEASPGADHFVREYGLSPGVLPSWLSRILMPPAWLLLGGALLLTTLVLLRKGKELVPVALCAVGLSLFPAFWLIFHADSIEYSRHALMTTLQVTTLLWVSSFVVAEAWLFPSERSGGSKRTQSFWLQFGTKKSGRRRFKIPMDDPANDQ